MFDQSVYRQRRTHLMERFDTGLLLFPGHAPSPINFADNPYPFRQDSSFLYFCGLNLPGCALVIDIDHEQVILYGPQADLNDIIWTGPRPSLEELAARSGIGLTDSLKALADTLQQAAAMGRPVHYLPAYRADQKLMLGQLLSLSPEQVNDGVSPTLTKVVIAQREAKTSEEVAEIESAMGLCRKLFQTLIQHLHQENTAVALAGILEGVVKSAGRRFAFPPIITSRGEVLHNHPDNKPFNSGDLLLMDMGAESREHYASDFTRTIPVDGRFSTRQKDIYEIVLAAQKAAIAGATPGVRFLDLHLLAASTICDGLQNLGLMKGPVEDAVRQGAHALFYPTGLGHMIGLDVHDMESLGEDHVGYDDEIGRSSQFGLAALRLGRRLQAGFVVTVEPGIYFIPELIDQWRQDDRWASFIAFDKLESYRRFGGIRIEDVVHVTSQGSRVLGPIIPKASATIEAACSL